VSHLKIVTQSPYLGRRDRVPQVPSLHLGSSSHGARRAPRSLNFCAIINPPIRTP
jgi:hypothetical protein